MKKKAAFTIFMILLFFNTEENIGRANVFENNRFENTTDAKDYYESKLKKGTDVLIDSIIAYTKTFIGTPFKWGGDDVNGFDCSGLFHYVFQKFNLEIPRTSKYQVQQGERIPIDQAQKGDFLFFKGRNIKNNEVKHVSMVIGKENGSIVMIHSTHRGIVIDKLDQISYYKDRLLEARRINVYEESETAIINASNLYAGFLR